jgi:type IV pilus assembly protein PilB
MPTPRLRLGQLLVDAKMITPAALDEVLAAQRADGRRLGTLLVERGLVNETQLTQSLSHQLSVPWVSLLHIEFSRQLLNLVPRAVAERFCLVPIYVRHARNQGETLFVAMDDPTNDEGLRECMAHSGLPVKPMIAPPADIRSAIRVYYGGTQPRLAAVEGPSSSAAVAARAELDTEPPVAPPAEPAASPAEPAVSTSPPEALAPAAESAEVASAPPPAADTLVTPHEPEAAVAAEAVAAIGAEAAVAAEAVAAIGAEAAEVPVPSSPVALATTPTAPEVALSAPPEVALPASPEVALAASPDAAPPEPPPEDAGPAMSSDAPTIEAVEIAIPKRRSEPPLESAVERIPQPRGRAPRMVALTLLDGTTISLPARAKRRAPSPDEPPRRPSRPAPPDREDRPRSEPPTEEEPGLTARDLVAALRAVSHGTDASEILGNNVRWEAMFAALLSLLLKKHLIADWEFVDELKKI